MIAFILASSPYNTQVIPVVYSKWNMNPGNKIFFRTNEECTGRGLKHEENYFFSVSN